METNIHVATIVTSGTNKRHIQVTVLPNYQIISFSVYSTFLQSYILYLYLYLFFPPNPS